MIKNLNIINITDKNKKNILKYQIAIILGYFITQCATLLIKVLKFSSITYFQIIFILTTTISFTSFITLLIFLNKSLFENYVNKAVKIQFIFWLIIYTIWIYFLHEARDLGLIFAFMPLIFLIINSGYVQSLFIVLILSSIQIGTSFFAIYFKQQSGNFLQTIVYTISFFPSALYTSYAAGLFQKYRSRLKKSKKEIEKAYESLWAEMGIAKKIQTILLPKSPKIPGYEIAHYMEPTDQVGGDYYDIINTDEFNWIVIGDVSGHGVPAGLIMMMVQSTIRSHITENPNIKPSDLIKIVNKLIQYNIKQMKENKFMTITAFSISQDNTINYSGRHEDIIFYDSNKDEIRILKSGGMSLSQLPYKNPDVNFKFEINKNDIMLLYTDGLTEACKKRINENEKNNDIFGVEKLKEILYFNRKKSPEEIKNSILFELENYEIVDDVTILVIKNIK